MYVWETISYGKKNLRQNKNHRGNKKKLKGRTSKRRGRRKNDVERSGGKASPATAPSPNQLYENLNAHVQTCLRRGVIRVESERTKNVNNALTYRYAF